MQTDVQDMVARPDRPVEFRTLLFLYMLLGAVMALTIHFVVLSSPRFNWLGMF